jgi:hypothetical protein
MTQVVLSSPRELAEWRNRIETAWSRSVESVIQVGRMVKEAKDALGVSYSLLETQLPFSSTVAAFLIKIAENPVLSNPAYFSRLPNGYNTLYHLTSVDEGQLIEQIENGEITPNFTLARAKSLREAKPNSKSSKAEAPSVPKAQTYTVGTLSIAAPAEISKFHADLKKLLEKYDGTVNYTHAPDSLAELHRATLNEQSLLKVKEGESNFEELDHENLRILEDAAHYLSKKQNKKDQFQIVTDGKLRTRECLPSTYKDLARIQQLLGIEHVTRGQLVKWCSEHNIPNQFTKLDVMDKELYIWEQARLVTDRKDVKGGLKRLNDLATRSTVENIKSLAQTVLNELTRFDNKA